MLMRVPCSSAAPVYDAPPASRRSIATEPRDLSTQIYKLISAT